MGALHPVHVYQLIMTNSVEDMLQNGDIEADPDASKPSLCLAAAASQNAHDSPKSPSKRSRKSRAKTLTKKLRRNIQKIESLMSNLRLYRPPEQPRAAAGGGGGEGGSRSESEGEGESEDEGESESWSGSEGEGEDQSEGESESWSGSESGSDPDKKKKEQKRVRFTADTND